MRFDHLVTQMVADYGKEGALALFLAQWSPLPLSCTWQHLLEYTWSNKHISFMSQLRRRAWSQIIGLCGLIVA
jgi:hypothetical protein